MSRRHVSHSSSRVQEPDDDDRSPAGIEPLTPMATGEAQRPEIAEQREWEMDCLVELMGRHYDESPSSPAFTDERLFAWMARELRESPDPLDDEVWPTDEAADIARRIQGRVRAARIAMSCAVGGPEAMRPTVAGTVERTIGAAAEVGCAPRLDLAPAAGLGRELWDEECESWVVLPSELPRGRYLALTVSGDSMTPLLHAGDVILVKLGPTVVRDSVVVARHPDDGYVIKRVGVIGGATLELCSLNPEFPPIRIPRCDDAILGTVILRWCDHAGRKAAG